jgi:hypothetical protein
MPRRIATQSAAGERLDYLGSRIDLASPIKKRALKRVFLWKKLNHFFFLASDLALDLALACAPLASFFF